MKTIFFGSSKFVYPIIEVLKKNFNLSLVITTEKSGGAVPSFCTANKIPYRSVTTLSDSNLKSLIIDLKSPVAVVADFGLIIPKEILNAFPKGMINIHPSLLPQYRGPAPVQAAILNGEKTTGVSIMKLDEKVDHGPILKQEKEEILDTDTSETLYKRLFEIGANLLPEVLNKYFKDNLSLIPQNHTKATFTKTLIRSDGYIDISCIKDGKLKIENLRLKIRAYSPWPGVWFKTKLNGKEKIVKLLPNAPNGQILFQVGGKKPMTCKDFLNGYPEGKEVILKLKLCKLIS